MATPISVSIPHKLGRAEARRRIAEGFSKMAKVLPGGDSYTERWEGDRLTFKVSGLGQAASGVIEVFDTTVSMHVELPAVLAMLANGLKGRIEKAGQLLLTKK